MKEVIILLVLFLVIVFSAHFLAVWAFTTMHRSPTPKDIMYFWSGRIMQCLQQARTREQLRSCRALIRNFKRAFDASQEARWEYDAMTVVYNIKRDALHQKLSLTQTHKAHTGERYAASLVSLVY